MVFEDNIVFLFKFQIHVKAVSSCTANNITCIKFIALARMTHEHNDIINLKGVTQKKGCF